MKDAAELKTDELVMLVSELQCLMYMDEDEQHRERWNPYKPWRTAECKRIDQLMAQYDLVPTELKLL